MTDFETFWAAFPRKRGKLAAVKAYERARHHGTPEEILAGVACYIADKPEYADWCYPATWLNQGRWTDEPDALPAIVTKPKASAKPQPQWLLDVRAKQAKGVA